MVDPADEQRDYSSSLVSFLVEIPTGPILMLRTDRIFVNHFVKRRFLLQFLHPIIAENSSASLSTFVTSQVRCSSL